MNRALTCNFYPAERETMFSPYLQHHFRLKRKSSPPNLINTVSCSKPQMSSAGHKIPSFLFHPQFHTSQRCGSVEKSDKVRILSHFPPVMNPLSFFTQFYTSQRCGSVEKSDKVRILSHFPPVMNPLSFFTQFHTSQRSGSVEKSDKVRILSHFPQS